MPTVYSWMTADEDLYVAFWPSGGAALSPKRTMEMHYHQAGQQPSVITQSGY